MANQKTLDLSTLTDTIKVTAGGQTFDLRPVDDLAPIEMSRISKMGRRIDELIVKGDLTTEEEAELERLPLDICKIVTAGVDLDKLKPNERWAICRTFTKPPQTTTAPSKPAATAKAK